MKCDYQYGFSAMGDAMYDVTRRERKAQTMASVLEDYYASNKSKFFPRERWDCRRQVGLPEEGRLVRLGGAIGGACGVSAVFDAHLSLLDRYPDVHQVLVGRVDKGAIISESANIHYLGELEY